MKSFLTILITITNAIVFGQIEQKQNPIDFLPKGFVVYEKLQGDLNKDGVEDYVLIIKGKDKKQIVANKQGNLVDRNRRGIIVLFHKNGHYELALKNYTCFSSENEEGGNYYAPELWVDIKKGNLYFGYEHGRYGNWKYTFRFQNSDFELIGYDASENQGPVINSETSINFSTKTKVVKVNTNASAETEQEIFKTTTQKIKIGALIKLSEIKDLEELDRTIY